MSSPASAEAAFQRLVGWARRSGENVDPVAAKVQHALRGTSVLSEKEIDRLAAVLWARSQQKSPRGFNATSDETKQRWRGVAEACVRTLGHEIESDRGRPRPAPHRARVSFP